MARNVSPFTVEPGKFTYRLVRGELEFAEYGHGGRPLPHRPRPWHVVPFTLLPPVEADSRTWRSPPRCRSIPTARVAVGEVGGRGARRARSRPVDLAVLFVTGAHRRPGRRGRGGAARCSAPTTLIGATAVAVLAGDRGVEDGPGVALFGRPPAPSRRTPVRLRAARLGDGRRRARHGRAGRRRRAHGGTLVLVADPFRFPADGFLGELAPARPDLAVIGGMASAAAGARAATGWSSTARAPPTAPSACCSTGHAAPRPVVSQGCRPIGAAA